MVLNLKSLYRIYHLFAKEYGWTKDYVVSLGIEEKYLMYKCIEKDYKEQERQYNKVNRSK